MTMSVKMVRFLIMDKSALGNKFPVQAITPSTGQYQGLTKPLHTK